MLQPSQSSLLDDKIHFFQVCPLPDRFVLYLPLQVIPNSRRWNLWWVVSSFSFVWRTKAIALHYRPTAVLTLPCRTVIIGRLTGSPLLSLNRAQKPPWNFIRYPSLYRGKFVCDLILTAAYLEIWKGGVAQGVHFRWTFSKVFKI